ncbi:hypothetical protein FKM82_017896 [Ascaphus truei]
MCLLETLFWGEFGIRRELFLSMILVHRCTQGASRAVYWKGGSFAFYFLFKVMRGGDVPCSSSLFLDTTENSGNETGEAFNHTTTGQRLQVQCYLSTVSANKTCIFLCMCISHLIPTVPYKRRITTPDPYLPQRPVS